MWRNIGESCSSVPLRSNADKEGTTPALISGRKSKGALSLQSQINTKVSQCQCVKDIQRSCAHSFVAMVQGFNFAGRIGQQGYNYKDTSAALLCFLQDFWNADEGFVEANGKSYVQ